jgi:hypothetical protein
MYPRSFSSSSSSASHLTIAGAKVLMKGTNASSIPYSSERDTKERRRRRRRKGKKIHFASVMDE